MESFGTTTIPLAGWMVNPRRAERERDKRLTAIRQIVSQYGLQAVELTLDFSMLYPEVFNRDFYEAVGDLQLELGFVCTLHLPFLWLDPCALNETMRKASVEVICKGYELTSAIEVQSCVLHLWGNMTQIILSVLEDAMRMIGMIHRQAGRSLEALSNQIPLEKICVETLERPSFDLFAEVIETHNLGICLDVGHLYWQGGDYIEFVKRYRERIKEVHLHDARRKVPSQGGGVVDHLPLGEGEIKPADFLKQLEEMDYKGAVILENNTLKDLERSMDWLNGWKTS